MSIGLTSAEFKMRYVNSEYFDHYNIFSDLLTVANITSWYVTEEGGSWPELGNKDDLIQFHLGLALVIKSCSNSLLRLLLVSLKDDKAREKIRSLVEV